MKRFLYLVVLMALSSSADAGNSFSFVVAGHRVTIEAPRDCNSPSCVSVSIPGVHQTRRARESCIAHAVRDGRSFRCQELRDMEWIAARNLVDRLWVALRVSRELLNGRERERGGFGAASSTVDHALARPMSPASKPRSAAVTVFTGFFLAAMMPLKDG